MRIRTEQRVLVETLGQLPADADGGRVLQIDVDPWDLRQLWPQLLNHLIHAGSLGARFQPYKHTTGIARHAGRATRPGGASDSIDVGVLANDGVHSFLMLHHSVKGNILGSLGKAENETGVLVRDESHGDDGEKIDSRHQEQSGEDQGRHAVV